MARIEELAGNNHTQHGVHCFKNARSYSTCQKQNQNETVSDVASRFEWHISS